MIQNTRPRDDDDDDLDGGSATTCPSNSGRPLDDKRGGAGPFGFDTKSERERGGRFEEGVFRATLSRPVCIWGCEPWKDLIHDAGAQNLQVIQRGSDTIYQSSGHRAAVLPV